jgi:hypothetical protein
MKFFLFVMMFTAPPHPKEAEVNWAFTTALSMEFDSKTACESARTQIYASVEPVKPKVEPVNTMRVRALCLAKSD